MGMNSAPKPSPTIAMFTLRSLMVCSYRPCSGENGDAANKTRGGQVVSTRKFRVVGSLRPLPSVRERHTVCYKAKKATVKRGHTMEPVTILTFNEPEQAQPVCQQL